MSSKNYNDPVYKQKRIPKNPIKFNIQLNEEQKEAKNVILNNTITVLKGKAGSSKTLLACNVALDLLFKKEIERIFIARPFIYAENESIGILPGGVQDKLIGITTPIIENMYMLTGKDKIDKLISEGIINILPVAFMRGLTINNSIMILDEFQNATLSQTYTALSRLGKGSKIIVTGDMAQCDLKNKKDSGFDFFKKLETENIPGLKIITLVGNHRHDLVEQISKIYDNYKD
jgi:phosphate starvation-inducible PhoH-like protein